MIKKWQEHKSGKHRWDDREGEMVHDSNIITVVMYFTFSVCFECIAETKTSILKNILIHGYFYKNDGFHHKTQHSYSFSENQHQIFLEYFQQNQGFCMKYSPQQRGFNGGGKRVNNMENSYQGIELLAFTYESCLKNSFFFK